MSERWTAAWQAAERYWAARWRSWVAAWLGAAAVLTVLFSVNPSVNQVLFLRLHANNTTHWVNLPHLVWRGGPTAWSLAAAVVLGTWWTAGVLGRMTAHTETTPFVPRAWGAWGRSVGAWVSGALVAAAAGAVVLAVSRVASRDATWGLGVLLGVVVAFPAMFWCPPLMLAGGIRAGWRTLWTRFRQGPLEIWGMAWLFLVTQVLNGMIAAAVAWTLVPLAGDIAYALVFVASLMVYGYAAVSYGEGFLRRQQVA
jgi:hypothetical protein